MENLAKLGKSLVKRASTYDLTGSNRDSYFIEPGDRRSLEISGAGCIKHIWFTLLADDIDYLKKVQLRMYWDCNEKPAVDVPFCDFFCLGHGVVDNVVSAAICVSVAPHIPSPPGQAAFNCYFPMPFANGARVEVINGCSKRLSFYGHLDYEYHNSPDAIKDQGRFYAQYRHEKTTPAADTKINTTGDDNYVILDIEGDGHYVGCNMSVVCNPDDPGKWWEGDDMIFVDGESWPPDIHGTGTEDYFGSAWGVRQQFCTPYYGISYMNKRFGDGYIQGEFTVYRFHIPDPIPFRKSIRVTIEHGHANDAANDYSSVAYWYQAPNNQ